MNIAPRSLLALSPVRGLIALGKLLRDPDDLPQVFTVIQSLSGGTDSRLVRRLARDPDGAQLLAERPDIVPRLSDRARLAQLPEGSLGRAYLAFMESEAISAGGIMDASAKGLVPVHKTPELQFFNDRMRDTHDLWHAATGYRGDVLGEAALLAFTLAQTRNPGVALIVAAGLWKTRNAPEARRLILDGLRRGLAAAWLPATRWETLLALPLDEVRRRLRLEAPAEYVPVRSSEIKAAQTAAAANGSWLTRLWRRPPGGTAHA